MPYLEGPDTLAQQNCPLERYQAYVHECKLLGEPAHQAGRLDFEAEVCCHPEGLQRGAMSDTDVVARKALRVEGPRARLKTCLVRVWRGDATNKVSAQRKRTGNEKGQLHLAPDGSRGSCG
jgi:hypothetical protein